MFDEYMPIDPETGESKPHIPPPLAPGAVPDDKGNRGGWMLGAIVGMITMSLIFWAAGW